jgi:hypothetical protein
MTEETLSSTLVALPASGLKALLTVAVNRLLAPVQALTVMELARELEQQEVVAQTGTSKFHGKSRTT